MPSGSHRMPNRLSNGEVDRILIVDDDPATLLALSALLKTHFPDVLIQTAMNTDGALGLVSDYRYRLILLDVRMPGMDGLAFLRQAFESLGTAKVIVMTGAIDDNLEAEALKAGAHAVLQKPVLTDVLIDTIRASLKDHPGES